MAYGFNDDKSKVELKSAVKTDGDQVTVTVPGAGEATAIISLPLLKGKAILGIVRVTVGVNTRAVPLLSFGITEDLSGTPQAEVTLGNNTNNSIGTGVIVEVAYID